MGTLAGITYYNEAQRLLALELDHLSLTPFQAVSLMSTWEANSGRHITAALYSRQAICMAIAMGLHIPMNDASTVDYGARIAAFWGAFMSDQ